MADARDVLDAIADYLEAKREHDAAFKEHIESGGSGPWSWTHAHRRLEDTETRAASTLEAYVLACASQRAATHD